jgi:hypothetical protein
MAGPVARPAAWALAVCLAAFLAGCGGQTPGSGPVYPVKGKITLPDGKPLSGVRVVFMGPVTSGATTEGDGSFTVKEPKDGLPEGDYSIRLEIVETKVSGKKTSLPPFPGKYLDEDTSELKAKVTAAGPNDFDFKLTKGEGAAETKRGTGSGSSKVRD